MVIESYGKATLFQKICRKFAQKKKGYGTMLVKVSNDWKNEY